MTQTTCASAGSLPPRRLTTTSWAQVEHNLPRALELLELAVTWSELDYSDVAVIPPSAWLEFAAEHRWHDPWMVERLFRLTDLEGVTGIQLQRSFARQALRT